MTKTLNSEFQLQKSIYIIHLGWPNTKSFLWNLEFWQSNLEIQNILFVVNEKRKVGLIYSIVSKSLDSILKYTQILLNNISVILRISK